MTNKGDLISREALKKAIEKAFETADLSEYEACICVSEIYDKEIDNAPTVEYTFEEAFQKTVCEQRLYCPQRPQGECEKCTYRIFTEKFTDSISEVMALYGITSVEELQERLQAELKGKADQLRDCENCVHHSDNGCEVWECEFEKRSGL